MLDCRVAVKDLERVSADEASIRKESMDYERNIALLKLELKEVKHIASSQLHIITD